MQASAERLSVEQAGPFDTVRCESPSEAPEISVVEEDVHETIVSPPPGRQAVDTVPYAKATAKRLFGKKRKKIQLLDDDDDRHEGGDENAVPDWCIDDGTGLHAMTTFELWMSLARGEISPKAYVWRDGMDGWERIEEIPELAYAISDSVSFDPPLVMPAPLRGRFDARPQTPLSFSTMEAETLDPPDVHEPEAESSRTDPISLPVRFRNLRRRVRSGLSPVAPHGGYAFALGCVVAAFAIGIALVHQGVGPKTLQAARLTGEVKRAEPGVSEALKQATRWAEEARQASLAAKTAAEAEVDPSAVPSATVLPTTYIMPPPPIARRHTDPGQKRSRRSLRR